VEICEDCFGTILMGFLNCLTASDRPVEDVYLLVSIWIVLVECLVSYRLLRLVLFGEAAK